MQLHELKRTSTNKDAKRVGRGGKRGKTSGKGHKGQKARTGNSTRPNIRDVIKKIPKMRGHGKNRGRTVDATKTRAFAVNLSTLEANFEAGKTVSPSTLREKKLIPQTHSKPWAVKILGTGEISKTLSFELVLVSETAKTKIESAGGSIKE